MNYKYIIKKQKCNSLIVLSLDIFLIVNNEKMILVFYVYYITNLYFYV